MAEVIGGFLSWAIYHNPLDYPGRYVVRAFAILGGLPVPTDDVQLFDSLEDARASVPAGLHCEPRQEHEHPSVVEVWF